MLITVVGFTSQSPLFFRDPDGKHPLIEEGEQDHRKIGIEKERDEDELQGDDKIIGMPEIPVWASCHNVGPLANDDLRIPVASEGKYGPHPPTLHQEE